MVQTDNSYLADKVALRVAHLPEADPLRVLDCFGGKGLIWKAVAKLTGRKILRLPIEIKEQEEEGFYLPGDNRAYLSSLDLARFDVIDLDGYGVPFDQLEMVFGAGYQGVVFVTFIQTMMGRLPFGLLKAVGFTEEMVKKCPTLFGKSGWKYFMEYLALRGVSRIWHRSHARKHYFGFSCVEVPASGSGIQQAGRVEGHA